MKTMTCRELRGPCDLGHTGDDANAVIKAQDKHLKEAVAAGDETHAGADPVSAIEGVEVRRRAASADPSRVADPHVDTG